MTNSYRGIISFDKANHPTFKAKVDMFYEWCEHLQLDPQNDENWNSFCESLQNAV